MSRRTHSSASSGTGSESDVAGEVVATANGTVVQDVDARDKRFEVTGLAPTKNAATPYSGYKKVYRQDVSLSWKAVDPNSPEGP